MAGWTVPVGALLAATLAAALAALSQPHALHSLLAVSDQDLAEGQTADVIIILGYALFRSGLPTEPLKARVAAGVEAFQQGQAAWVVFSGANPDVPGGGGGKRPRSEANVMMHYARQLLAGDDGEPTLSNGNPSTLSEPSTPSTLSTPLPATWLLEEGSTSTRENALYSLRMAAEHRWSSALIVTSPFHQRRALLTFRKAAADLQLQPLPSIYIKRTRYVGHRGYELLGKGHWAVDAAVDVWDCARELLAFALYYAKGYV